MHSYAKQIRRREIISSLGYSNRIRNTHKPIWSQDKTTVGSLGASRWKPMCEVHKNQKCCQTTACFWQHVSSLIPITLPQYRLRTERHSLLTGSSTNVCPTCPRHGLHGVPRQVPVLECSLVTKPECTLHLWLWSFWRKIKLKSWPVLHIPQV